MLRGGRGPSVAHHDQAALRRADHQGARRLRGPREVRPPDAIRCAKRWANDGFDAKSPSVYSERTPFYRVITRQNSSGAVVQW